MSFQTYDFSNKKKIFKSSVSTVFVHTMEVNAVITESIKKVACSTLETRTDLE